MALDSAKIAREESPTADLEVRMQGVVLLGIFLKVTPFAEEAGLSQEKLMEGVEKAVRKYFGKRGEAVVQANLTAINRGYNEVFELSKECLKSDETTSYQKLQEGIELLS
jgi:pyruvate-ferredoxin/flavodoxin oxidoreductase